MEDDGHSRFLRVTPMAAASSSNEPFAALRSPVLASSAGPSSASSPPPGAAAAFRPRAVLFSSVVLLVLQAMQFGWSITQLNFSQFHTQRQCDARPVAPGTCLMFPGHTKTEWLYVVNLWLVGGMLGSIASGRISDRIGRKRTHLATCVVSIVAGTVQTAAPSLAVFTLGRFLAGVGTGVTSSLINGYINELSPPHLRNALGITFQISRGVGCISCGLMFFLTASPNGWRYISAVPIGLGAVGLLLAPTLMIESPPWLLTRGRRADAELAIATLFGEERIPQALAWMDAATQAAGRSKSAVVAAPLSRSTSRHDGLHDIAVVVTPPVQVQAPEQQQQQQDPRELTVSSPWRALFSSTFRAQTALAVALCAAQQLSGINAVFLYSSTTFKDAGLHDDRIGVLVINIFNLVPTLFAGSLGTRMGNRPLLLWGHVGMILCAVGITAGTAAHVRGALGRLHGGVRRRLRRDARTAAVRDRAVRLSRRAARHGVGALHLRQLGQLPRHRRRLPVHRVGAGGLRFCAVHRGDRGVRRVHVAPFARDRGTHRRGDPRDLPPPQARAATVACAVG
ncbi:hypothetical protein PINS_up011783 [Pythium insidiosum]|nr:hypothetical protein PINS_up011783 [Pythium insidiosum]